MTYFDPGLTPDQLKERFRELSQQLHPDHQGGDGEKFIAMKAEFDQYVDNIKRRAESITSTQAYQAAKVAINEFCRLMGWGDSIDQVIAEKGIKVIDNLKLPAKFAFMQPIIDRYKPIIKMMAAGQLADLDELVRRGETIVKNKLKK